MINRQKTKDNRQWIALGVGVVAVVALAAYGWIATAAQNKVKLPPFQLLTSISDTVFGRPFVLVQQPPIDSHWAISVADWGVKLILGLAIFKTIFMVFNRQWQAHAFRKMKGHIIICGAGERGSAIARRKLSVPGGASVVMIEKDSNTDQLGELRQNGAIVLEGNARDAEVLRLVGVERASQVIIVTNSDDNNLSIAYDVHVLTRHIRNWPKINVGIENFELRSFFRDRLPKIVANARVLGFQGRASRRLMLREAERLARDPGVCKKGAVILIEACAAFRDELIREAAVMMQFSGEERPTLLICGSSAQDEALFSTRFPAHNLVLDLRWSTQRADEVIPESGESSVDLAIFALETNSSTLEAAERFRIRHCIANEAVIACVRDGDELGHMAVKAAEKVSCACIESLYGLSLGDKDPLDESADEEGRLLHETYLTEERERRGQSEKTASTPNGAEVSWLELTESVKDSNRMAAMHHQIKRAAWSSRKEMSEQEMLEHLASSEHMRWMAEKIMNGWRWSGSKDRSSRDDTRLLHNNLIPFEQLDRTEQEKDIAIVSRALEISN